MHSFHTTALKIVDSTFPPKKSAHQLRFEETAKQAHLRDSAPASNSARTSGRLGGAEETEMLLNLGQTDIKLGGQLRQALKRYSLLGDFV